MPYQKTKEGRLVNEVTLGDGYPLSNDKQPLKVGGEASIINVSSPTPDGSVDGEVEVKGKLKAKDTVIQGDLKVFSDSDTYPQFVLQSKAGTQCQLRVQAAANSSSYVRIQNNQGYWKINKPASNTKLTFTNDTNTPLILDGNTATFAGDVTVDTDTLHVDSSNNRVGIGTTSPDQELHIAGTGSQIYLAGNAGGSGEGIVYKDAGGNSRFALHFPSSDVVSLCNRASNGTVEIRANTSTAGSSGEETVATFEDDKINFAKNVGIGTTSPDTLLHLASSSGDVQLKIEADTDNDNELDNPQVLFAQDGGAVTGGIGLDGSNNMRIENIWSNDAADVVFHASNAEKMRITGTGNVGIGTTSPTTTLDVNGTANFSDDVTLPDSKKIYLGNGNDLEIHHNGSNSVIKDNGTGDLSLQSNGAKVSMYDAANGAFMAKFNTGAGVELLHNGTEVFETTSTGVNIQGTVTYKHISVTSSSDAVDVSGATVVECTPSGNVSIGGFTGGVQGQVIHILKVDSGFGRVFLEHNEGTGNQDIFLSGGGDIALATRGGVTLYCTGSEWIALDK